MKQNMELSVSSCGSAADRWKQRPKRPLISKLIKRDQGNYAIILNEDISKSFRYLYLIMLLNHKTNSESIQKMVRKIQSMLLRQQYFEFEDMSIQMKKIGMKVTSILKELNVLRKKIQAYKNDNLAILKVIHQYDIADPLLILALRAIASSPQLNIKQALNCHSSLGLNQIDDILVFFGNQKLPSSSKNNRFVIFTDMPAIQCQFFKQQGISIQNQATNYLELSDPHLFNYEEHIMIEKLYSLL